MHCTKIIGESNGDQFASSLGGGGDLNQDGSNDLVIGARAADGNAVDSGKGYVIYGRAAGYRIVEE